jgi:hypothetical protein
MTQKQPFNTENKENVQQKYKKPLAIRPKMCYNIDTNKKNAAWR